MLKKSQNFRALKAALDNPTFAASVAAHSPCEKSGPADHISLEYSTKTLLEGFRGSCTGFSVKLVYGLTLKATQQSRRPHLLYNIQYTIFMDSSPPSLLHSTPLHSTVLFVSSASEHYFGPTHPIRISIAGQDSKQIHLLPNEEC